MIIIIVVGEEVFERARKESECEMKKRRRRERGGSGRSRKEGLRLSRALSLDRGKCDEDGYNLAWHERRVPRWALEVPSLLPIKGRSAGTVSIPLRTGRRLRLGRARRERAEQRSHRPSSQSPLEEGRLQCGASLLWAQVMSMLSGCLRGKVTGVEDGGRDERGWGLVRAGHVQRERPMGGCDWVQAGMPSVRKYCLWKRAHHDCN